MRVRRDAAHMAGWVASIGSLSCLLLAGVVGAPAAGTEQLRGQERQPAVAGSGTSGIEGQVAIGPIRSVQRQGAPSQRPYQTHITVLDAAGHEVAAVQSDSEGKFRVPLPPGRYTLRPERPALYPRASEQQVEVKPGKMTPITIIYDSGRR